MLKFFQSLDFPHWSFLVGALAAIATFVGSYVQLQKEKQEANESKKIELERTGQYKTLLGKNIRLQETSNEIILKADHTLEAQSILQKNLKEALEKTREQLEKTKLIIESQNEVIKNQDRSLKLLHGGEIFPKIIFEFKERILGST